MPSFPIARNEAQRLARLQSLNILDTPEEEAFDRITHVAATALNVPVAVISLVDKDRQWFKSRIGIPISETSREDSFCAHAICHNDLTVIEDASLDHRFSSNPFVTGYPKIRFYAGAPLHIEGGINIGTLCVIDSKPRVVTINECDFLMSLAEVVIRLIKWQPIDRAVPTEPPQLDLAQ